jgi:hypothetical protein
MFDSAALHLVLVATPAAVGGSELLYAAIDPLALFLMGGAGTLFAALCYGIHSSWKDEVAGPHRLYAEEESRQLPADGEAHTPPASSASANVDASRTLPSPNASVSDVSRRTTKLAS